MRERHVDEAAQGCSGTGGVANLSHVIECAEQVHAVFEIFLGHIRCALWLIVIQPPFVILVDDTLLRVEWNPSLRIFFLALFLATIVILATIVVLAFVVVFLPRIS